MFPAFIVRERSSQSTTGRAEWLPGPAATEGDLTIAVDWSSLNYKDALAAQGNPAIAGPLPHVPGIDCAGTVKASSSDQFREGDLVLVTGYGLGAPHWGGWSGEVRVPAEWVVPMPRGLDTRRAMIIGTAGFTAAQCVGAIVDRGITPARGSVAVTGATGGVGVWAVRLLAALGYHVLAVSGKAEHHDALRELGASEVVGRDLFVNDPGKPMLAERFAAAVDTVGGQPLSWLVRSLSHRGVVAACGLVAGTDLPLTVYPFLLRGVTLHGIDSAKCPRPDRMRVWERLTGEWQTDLPPRWVNEVTLDDVAASVTQMLGGGMVGRTIVRPTTTSPQPAAGD